MCLYDELVSVKKLKPHPKNRNIHPKEQIERLAKMIAFQGIRAPIVVSKLSGFIVKGHGTLMALEENKVKDVPVVYQDFDNTDQEYAFVQGDNAIAAWAELDLSGINMDIPELGPMDIDLLGLKDFNLNFEAGSLEQQGKLDKKDLVYMECPNCGEEFEKSQAKIKN